VGGWSALKAIMRDRSRVEVAAVVVQNPLMREVVGVSHWIPAVFDSEFWSPCRGDQWLPLARLKARGTILEKAAFERPRLLRQRRRVPHHGRGLLRKEM
jgi:hypothetical protein